ncbi:MAG: serine/threonine protein kinase, partial [Polyangiaceae bacterium]|nr:serine/threonine protein kinase [Polyangiaceae bacterium]
MTDRDVPPDDPTTVLPRAREHAGRHEPSSPTTTAENGGSTNRRVDPSALPLASPGRRKRRYGYGKVIGRGGMGEVLLAQDRRIGRSVALKVMLEEAATRADAHRRFLREARVQGQLEHPAIVPVYDLGWDREGRPYFAMKRISGVTLGDVIRELRKGDPDHENRYSLRRLISMFQQVCLAIEYAHSRGVVHRDLKPSNLMLGDFGEVYVLDWGIAKLLDTSEPSTSSLTLPLDTDDATRHDEVLGTIGYMAPEQLTSPTTVDARADVYSLGAVLFHILTLEPLHGYGTAQERARSTQLGAEARPTRRAPDRELPPELDGVCERATALNPNDRYQSARALHDALEAFLEGDRDTRLRAELAEQHVENARLAAQRMATDGPDASDQRKRALREAGRA